MRKAPSPLATSQPSSSLPFPGSPPVTGSPVEGDLTGTVESLVSHLLCDTGFFSDTWSSPMDHPATGQFLGLKKQVQGGRGTNPGTRNVSIQGQL